jgi:hypothetical protein
MGFQPDLVVDSFARRTVLTVECISSRSGAVEEAVYLRDTFLPDEIDVDDCFFMLARLSVIDLWLPRSARGALPNYTAPAPPILSRYVSDTSHLYSALLRGVIARWLASVTYGRAADATEAEQMLVASGLYAKLRGGDVRQFDDM